MRKSFLIALLIVMCLANSTKTMSEVFSSSDIQQGTENTDVRLFEFFLRTSTGEIITRASVYVYNSDGNLISSMWPNDKGVCQYNLLDDQTYNFFVYSWDTKTQTDNKSFTVNKQNVSTTITFYPVTFKMRNPDGSKFAQNPKFVFNESYQYADLFKWDENLDPVFLFPSGHYTYKFYLDSSYPGLTGSFDVGSSSQVVDYINQTHEVKFEFKDSEGGYLPGAVRINDSYVDFSTWGEARPFSIHLPDGEYNCLIWSSSCGVGINEKLIIAGEDTTIIINHHKIIVNILNNNNEPLDFEVFMSTETGNTVKVKKIDAGVYSADVLNEKYTFIIYKYGVSYSMPQRTVVVQDADTTLNVILSQCRLNVKTTDGNIVKIAKITIKNENNEYMSGNGELLLYLADGQYTYSVITTNNFIETTYSFEINREDKEITLWAYPVTFKVMLSSQVPVLNYDISFNGYYTRPDQKDEYTSKFLLLQGEYEYEVLTNSLLRNYISNKGRVKVDDSKEIPITFYSAEFSVKIDGKPATGSKVLLRQDDSQYSNEVSLFVNEEGKIRDYVSNGLYRFTITPTGICNNHTGSFIADNKNVNIYSDFYSVRFHIGQSSINYHVAVIDTDTGEWTLIAQGNDSVLTAHLTPGHYVYGVYFAYIYNGLVLSEGNLVVENKPVDIDESFLSHHFIVLNPEIYYVYRFRILKNNYLIIDNFINKMDTLTYYLPKGEYQYECYGSGGDIFGNFKIENSGDKTYILFDQTVIPTIDSGDESCFKIYPNPANDMIWFNSMVSGEISISTIDGRNVLNQTLHQQKRLNISQLKTGIYVVKFYDNLNRMIILRKLVVK